MGFQYERRKQLNYMELANDIPSIELKGRNFLDLLNNNYCSIKPTYIKDDTWLNFWTFKIFVCESNYSYHQLHTYRRILAEIFS